MLEERFKKNSTPLDTQKCNASSLPQETKLIKSNFRRKCVQHPTPHVQYNVQDEDFRRHQRIKKV
jgi:hypothetical protein